MMEWLGWLFALFIAIGIIGSIVDALKTWPKKRALEREVRERGLERLVFDGDESADPDIKVGYIDGIKVLYWDEDCFDTAKELLKWRDRSADSILRLKLDALEQKDGTYLFKHRWGDKWDSTLSEMPAEDDRRRKLLLAAEDGDKDACRALGRIYYHGTAVPQDHVQAYMWYTLSDADEITDLKFNLTHKQRAEAKKLARQRKRT